MYVGYKDGKTSYQDAFGRTRPESKHLNKKIQENELGPNDLCGCGNGKKYKKCCKNKSPGERSSWKVLSIRERNMIFYNGLNDILGFNKGKTWEDVRRELSNEQIIRIHELYGFLWPIDTDIVSLLPKPDKSLRAVYTGIIDPRLISEFALALTPCIDEIIIQSPFINPDCFRPEYSPVHSPHQYKHQTLKNVMLFLTLMPFIDAGYINLIPDPCFFNDYLRKQMSSMAEERTKNPKISGRDKEVLERLHKEDFNGSLYMLSKEQQKRQILRATPNLSDKEVQEMLQYFEEKKLANPFLLLQDNVFGTDGGQLSMMNMTPNFEISLFIAQVTGSLLLTDSEYRWNEIKDAQAKEDGMIVYNWADLTATIDKLEYIITGHLEESFLLRHSGKLGNFRKAMKEIYLTIQDKANEPSAKIEENLKQQLLKAHASWLKEVNKDGQYSFVAKLSCLIPIGGIVHNNVQRLLLAHGIENHLNSVPMAIFAEVA